jgi:hypothetical protein
MELVFLAGGGAFSTALPTKVTVPETQTRRNAVNWSNDRRSLQKVPKLPDLSMFSILPIMQPQRQAQLTQISEFFRIAHLYSGRQRLSE